MFNMFSMMSQLKGLQENLKKTQEKLATTTITAESGGGMVRATVNGRKKLLSVQIDPSLSDMLIVQDLVVAAVNQAMDEAAQKAKEEIKKSTQGVLPNIPGLDLESLL